MPNDNNPTQNPELIAALRAELARLEAGGRPVVPVIASPDGEGVEMILPPDAVVNDDNRNPRRGEGRNGNPRNRREGDEKAPGYGEVAEVGILVTPDERDTFQNLVIYEDCTSDIKAGVRAIERRADMERIWNIGKIQPQDGRCVLNFFGPPGTGKTRAARALAKLIGKNLYQVDYSAVISKYLGDTAKHIAHAFKRAKELNAILFFDEADSLLSKRVDMDQSCATSINQNRNALMQELDRFNGVVIVTTNLFGNYDPALIRRIARHIKFRLPNRAMRKQLLELHLPNMQRVTADLGFLAEETKGFSGGDILNVCVNGIYAASAADSTDEWKLTQAILLNEIEAIRIAKAEHNGKE